MKRYYTYICFLLALMMVCPSQGVSKENRKKKEKAENNFEPDPSPMSSKAKPDTPAPRLRHPRGFKVVETTEHEGGIQGIDISHYQSRIDWDRLKKSDIPKFIYVKATEGKSIVDRYYQSHFTQAKAHGFKVGSYHFFRPAVDVDAQYRLFIRNIDVKKQDLLPLIDVEIISGVASIDIFQRRLLTFCKLVAHAFNGQKPIIYTGKSFYDRYIVSNRQLCEYQFMIAAYQDEQPTLNNGADYLIWQYTGRGSIDGISGHVDRSRFIGTHTLSEILVNQKKIPDNR